MPKNPARPAAKPAHRPRRAAKAPAAPSLASRIAAVLPSAMGSSGAAAAGIGRVLAPAAAVALWWAGFVLVAFAATDPARSAGAPVLTGGAVACLAAGSVLAVTACLTRRPASPAARAEAPPRRPRRPDRPSKTTRAAGRRPARSRGG